MIKVVAIIQARLGSTRFPNKVLEPLDGMTVIDRVRRAAERIAGVHEVCVAWPESAPNRAENDVLGRYADVATDIGATVIVRLTGDCPLFDPQVGRLVLGRFMLRSERPCYVSNVHPRRTFPDGMDCEVFDRYALDLADREATHPYDREHVTPFMQRKWTRDTIALPVDWSRVRLTLDTKEDLEWLKVAIRAPQSP